jgi:hypothetical protein
LNLLLSQSNVNTGRFGPSDFLAEQDLDADGKPDLIHIPIPAGGRR